MGLGGPLPKSNLVELRRGNLAKKAKVVTVGATPGAPAAPRAMGKEGRAEWRRIVPELDRLGTIAFIDRSVLIAYCDAWDNYSRLAAIIRDADDLIPDGGAAQIPMRHPAWQMYRDSALLVARLAKDVGIGPILRIRIPIPKGDFADDDDILD